MRAIAAALGLATVVSLSACGSHHDALTPSASKWLSAQVAAARTAASHREFDQARVDVAAIEQSVRSLQSQGEIDGVRAQQILLAVANLRTALSPFTTTTVPPTTPSTTLPPSVPHGKHGKGHDNQNGD
jgi:hypothetical protein